MIDGIHLNTGKNWLQNVVSMNNDRIGSVFQLLRFLICVCFFSVLFFNFFAFVGFMTTTFHKFQFQSQVSVSQVKVKVPLRLKFKLYAVFIEWGSGIRFLFVWRQSIINQKVFLPTIPGNFEKKVDYESCLTWSRSNVCKNASSRPSSMFCRFCLIVSPCLLYVYGCLPLPPTVFQPFSHSLSSHTLCSCLESLQPLQPLAEQTPTSQQPQFLRVGQQMCARMEFRFPPRPCPKAPKRLPGCRPLFL